MSIQDQQNIPSTLSSSSSSSSYQNDTQQFEFEHLPYQVATLTCVRAGKAMPFTREQLSAINKYPVDAPVEVNYMGLLSDEQADMRNHGGYLKAVHQMSVETYAKLNEAFNLSLNVGELGENLNTKPVDNVPNLNEHTVCIGDIYQYGIDSKNSVQLLVVQPRRPCYKINDQIGLHLKTNVAAWISQQGISGWYFKVIQDGQLYHDLPVYLIKRPYPFANLSTLWALANQKKPIDPTIINQWLDIDCLEESWKKVLRKRSRD